MSLTVELEEPDYANILNWYQIAFGKNDNASTSDERTLIKISAMSMSFSKSKKKK